MYEALVECTSHCQKMDQSLCTSEITYTLRTAMKLDDNERKTSSVIILCVLRESTFRDYILIDTVVTMVHDLATRKQLKQNASAEKIGIYKNRSSCPKSTAASSP